MISQKKLRHHLLDSAGAFSFPDFVLISDQVNKV